MTWVGIGIQVFFFFFNFYFLLLDRSSDLDDGVYGELYMIGCRDLCNSSL